MPAASSTTPDNPPRPSTNPRHAWRQRSPGGDIQAHRSLAEGPNAANVVCVARVQALTTTAACLIVEAAATDGQIDQATATRFTRLEDASQIAWTKTATRWSELLTTANRPDPALIGAASQLRTAIATAVQGER